MTASVNNFFVSYFYLRILKAFCLTIKRNEAFGFLLLGSQKFCLSITQALGSSTSKWLNIGMSRITLPEIPVAEHGQSGKQLDQENIPCFLSLVKSIYL